LWLRRRNSRDPHNGDVIDKERIPDEIYFNVLTGLGPSARTLHPTRVSTRQPDAAIDLPARALFVALLGLLTARLVLPRLSFNELRLLLAVGSRLLAAADRDDTRF
jgi:hypothetical protein